jgi:hypothetical protein
MLRTFITSRPGTNRPRSRLSLDVLAVKVAKGGTAI